ncbi:unnamed protein product, partial [Chrysoparadoxa australica]
MQKRRYVGYHLHPCESPKSPNGHRFGVNRIRLLPATSPSGQASLLSAGRDGIIRQWSLEKPTLSKELLPLGHGKATLRKEFTGHTDWVTDLAVVEDDGLLISSSNDSTIKLWDLGSLLEQDPHQAKEKKAQPCATLAHHDDYVKALAYSQGGGLLASAGLDRRILVWDLKRLSSPLLHLGGGKGEAGRVRPSAVTLGPDDVMELSNQKKTSIYCLDIDSGGNMVVSGSVDRMIRLYDIRTQVKVCKMDGHIDTVRCVQLDKNDTRIVSGSSDGTIRVWDIRQQHCLGIYEPQPDEEDVQGIWCVRPSSENADVYYSGGRAKQIYRTDFMTGESSLVANMWAEVLDLALAPAPAHSSSKPCEPVWCASTSPTISLWGERQADRGEEGAIAPIFKEPSWCITGRPGVVRYKMLNNRRHLLTADSDKPSNIGLWDMVAGKQIKQYPEGTDFATVEEELFQRIVVRPWCTIDVKLGVPMVVLSESTVFDGELCLVDAQAEPGSALPAPAAGDEPKLNLGEQVLLGLFCRWRERRKALLGHADRDEGCSDTSASPPQASRKLGSRCCSADPVAPFPDNTVVWVKETEVGGENRETMLLQQCCGDFDGREGEAWLPSWVIDCVWHGEFGVKPQVKIQFLLLPDGAPASLGSSGKGSNLARSSQHLTAPTQMRVCKVAAYVLSNDQLRAKLLAQMNKGEAGGTRRKSSNPPELQPEQVEILCMQEILDPRLYLGAVT